MAKERINIEDIEAHLGEHNRLNALGLRNVDFYKDGVPVNFPESIIEEFEMTGLSTLMFFTSSYWELALRSEARKEE